MKKILPLIIIVIAGIVLSLPLLRPGLPVQDDAVFMVLRLTGFHRSVVDGHLPVRWISQLHEGYGYPVMNFLYPLPFYLSEILVLMGLTPLAAIKVMFGLLWVVSGIGVWYWQRAKFKTFTWPVLLGLVYMVMPYRVLDVYQRGSLGEHLVFALLPWLFAFIDAYHSKPKLSTLCISSWLLGLVIMAHNSLALVFVPVVVGYWLFTTQSGPLINRVISLIILLSVSVGISCFFWLPALAELKYTVSASTPIVSSSSLYQPALTVLLNQGWLVLLSIVIGLVWVRNRFFWFWGFVSLVGILLQFPIANVWQLLLLDRLVQFPFRLAALGTFAVVPLLSYIGLVISKNTKKLIGVVLIPMVIITMLMALRSVSQVSTVTIDQSFFDTNFHTSTTKDEFTPKWVDQLPESYANQPFEILGRDGAYVLNHQIIKTQERRIQLSLEDTVTVRFNTHYFPGWTLWIDGNQVEPHIDGDGTMSYEVTVPSRRDKKRDIALLWQETPIRDFANKVSLITASISAVYLVWIVTHKNLKKTVAIVSIAILCFQIGASVFQRKNELLQIFDPVGMEQAYLESQWVNPDSHKPIGDHGLYTWAGWAYVHGENPILINSEMPPFGKYLIGLGLLLTQRAGMVGLGFSLFLLVSVFVLAWEVTKSWQYALVPVALYSTEVIFSNSIVFPMLDGLQIGSMALCFWAVIRAEKKARWFIVASLMAGVVLSSKFYATGILLITGIWIFLLLAAPLKQLIMFTLSVPIAFSVHVLSYLRYFVLGNSIRDYLGVQKYIYTFYKIGAPEVPIGSYWNLVFFNKWRVWWGAQWGEYYTLSTQEWRITWPVNAAIVALAIVQWISQILNRWRHKAWYIPRYHVLTVWLLCYSIFLTTIGGWPHYMGLFLPFSNILLVMLVIEYAKPMHKKIPKKVKLYVQELH